MKVGISIYLDVDLLDSIESNVEGKNRSEKLVKCAEAGYQVLNNRKR